MRAGGVFDVADKFTVLSGNQCWLQLEGYQKVVLGPEPLLRVFEIPLSKTPKCSRGKEISMAKRTAGTLLEIDISFLSKTPLHRQLYLAIKTAVLNGRLRPGARLPATRMIAEDLRLSRTTVLNAFDQLSAEGYLEGKIGSGTRVASAVPGDLKELALTQARLSQSRPRPRISRRARVRPNFDFSFLRTPARPLRPGQPEEGLFPLHLWSRLAAKHWRRATRDPEHADSLGYRPLRRAICDYIGKLRAVRCEPDQVLIVGGAQQALYLCAHTLLDPGDAVWMEDPGYPRARAAFLSAGLRIVPVPVDSDGLLVSVGEEREPAPKLVFVTPSFQCPLGAMMSLSRRFELLRFARQSKAWILEDDYFGEYRYGAGPVASLQSLDRHERVIYIGNFSKSIAPSLRIGYLVLPPALVEVFKTVRSSIGRQPPGVDQGMLAEFISEGHLENHLRTTLRLYRERQEALVDAIGQQAQGLLETAPSGTGMYLVAWLRAGLDDQAAARAAVAHGVDVIPLSAFSIRRLRRQGLVLGYSAYPVNHIRAAVGQLCEALSTMPPRGSASHKAPKVA
jgi:GntR family transcriptional regulator / MocR family aminotransferase